MVRPDGVIRPGWNEMDSTLVGAGAESLGIDATLISRRLHRHGITLDADGDQDRHLVLGLGRGHAGGRAGLHRQNRLTHGILLIRPARQAAGKHSCSGRQTRR